MKLSVLSGLLLAIFCAAIVGAPSVKAQTPPPTGGADQAQSYRLGADDKIRVLVYNEPDLSGQFFVSSSGNVSLPLIGDVPAVGRTLADLQQDITQRYSTGYLRNPRVNIEVVEFRPFFILGEVNKPGNYPYTSDLTVLKAVATANGFTYRADKHHAYVTHAGDTHETRYNVNDEVALHPGDTIRIGERYF